MTTAEVEAVLAVEAAADDVDGVAKKLKMLEIACTCCNASRGGGSELAIWVRIGIGRAFTSTTTSTYLHFLL